MISGCGSQLRIAPMGGPFGLDYGAVMTVAAAVDADTGLLAEILPELEEVMIARFDNEGGGD